MRDTIHQLAYQYENYLIEQRRHFHRHPELSSQEVETCKHICAQLKEMNIPYEMVGPTDIVGKIEGGKPGKKVAIRADIDALPVTEETPVSFRSENPGVMHACGHDAHTAILLATAKCLMEIRENLKGTIYLCFQSAEETGGGACAIVDYLKNQGGVDLAFGTHVIAAVPKGVMVIPTGAMMAGAGNFEITVTGQGGHGSRPDQSINPILPACNILQQIIAIPVNRHAPFDVCVVSPCIIQSGTVTNVIPNTAYIAGNMRYFKYGEKEKLVQTITTIAENTAQAYGATAKVTTKPGETPPVVNDSDSAKFAIESLKEQGIFQLYPFTEPATGSDNFGAFLQAFPGFYCIAGVKSSRAGTSSAQHNPLFDIEESALAPIVEFFVLHTWKFLESQ